MSNEFSITELRQNLYGAVGWQFHAPGTRPDIMDSLRRWRLVKSKSGGFDFNGTLSGIGFGKQAFRILDVSPTLRPDYIKTEGLGFKGVIVSLHQEVPFAGRTIIAEDKGVFNPTTVDLMQRVPFQCLDFDRVFEVYSDCADEANKAITSGLIKRLTSFSGLTFGQYAQCVMAGQDLHFLLHMDQGFQFSNDLNGQNLEAAKKSVFTEAGNICVLFEKLYRIQACIGKADTAEAAKARLDYYQNCLVQMIEKAKILKSDEMSTDPIHADTQLPIAPQTVRSADDRVQRKAS